MATLTVTVPEDLKSEIEELKIIDWSVIAREAIQQRVAQLRVLKAITAKSKLTEEEAEKLALELGRKVRKGIHERHVRAYGA